MLNMAGHGDIKKLNWRDEEGPFGDIDDFVILKPRDENEFNFYKMLNDAPIDYKYKYEFENFAFEYEKMITYDDPKRTSLQKKWVTKKKTGKDIADDLENFQKHTTSHLHYDKKDGYLVLKDLTGDPNYDYDVYDIKLGRRNFDSQVALRHFYQIGEKLPDHYCEGKTKWKNPQKTPPPYDCDKQINKVEKQKAKIKGDMLNYGLKVAGKVTIKGGKASKKQQLTLEELRNEKLHELTQDGKYKTIHANIEVMKRAWYRIMEYGFHAVGMSILIVVRKYNDKVFGFECKFIDFAHVEICSLVPDLLQLRRSNSLLYYENVSKQRIKEMQFMEIGYALHYEYKINAWYPIVDYMCKVLEDDKREPCPYANWKPWKEGTIAIKPIRRLRQLLLNFFMTGFFGYPVRGSYRELQKKPSKTTWKARVGEEERYLDDFGDGWVWDAGVVHGLGNLLLLSNNESLVKLEEMFDFNHRNSKTHHILRDLLKKKGGWRPQMPKLKY